MTCPGRSNMTSAVSNLMAQAGGPPEGRAGGRIVCRWGGDCAALPSSAKPTLAFPPPSKHELWYWERPPANGSRSQHQLGLQVGWGERKQAHTNAVAAGGGGASAKKQNGSWGLPAVASRSTHPRLMRRLCWADTGNRKSNFRNCLAQPSLEQARRLAACNTFLIDKIFASVFYPHCSKGGRGDGSPTWQLQSAKIGHPHAISRPPTRFFNVLAALTRADPSPSPPVQRAGQRARR